MAGYLTRLLNHLLDGKTLPIAQVVHTAPPVQCTQGQDVGLGQVDDVNIVAYTSTIPSRVIIAEDSHLVSLAQCHAQHNRNEM